MREYLTLVFIALSVGLDGFAVAVSIGLTKLSKGSKLRIALIFTLFETGMPLLGVIAGQHLVDILNGKASLIGGSLLVATALFQLATGHNKEEEKGVEIATKGVGSTVTAALAVSIDNLVIGFGIGTKNVSVALAALVIGIVSIVLVASGLELGRRLGKQFGKYGDYLASVILFFVGLAIIFKLI